MKEIHTANHNACYCQENGTILYKLLFPYQPKPKTRDHHNYKYQNNGSQREEYSWFLCFICVHRQKLRVTDELATRTNRQ